MRGSRGGQQTGEQQGRAFGPGHGSSSWVICRAILLDGKYVVAAERATRSGETAREEA
ncbi:hypothetical protein GCM10010510_46690 [Streptomyces anandii JCM 4720]|nr:hypothetical protein GCM10010510_46690 [Streptomyces anandii JCM 4720]